MIKKNKLTGEIDDLEKQIAKEKRELSSVLKQNGFETAPEFVKAFRDLKGQVDGYKQPESKMIRAGKIQWQPENHEEFHVSDCTKRNEMLQYRHKI